MTDALGSQLRGWDAATWRTSSDATMRSTVVALIVLERAPEWQELLERVDRLTRLVPVLRKRPLYGISGLSSPRLGIDPDFDLSVHVRRYRLPEGTSWVDVLNEARRISVKDFDRHRPLWDMALIEGLADGNAALVVKLHHAIADGAATVMMGLSLFDFSPEGNPDEPEAPPVPQGGDVSVRDVSIANATDNLQWGFVAAKTLVKGAGELLKDTLTDPFHTWDRTRELVSSLGRVVSMPSDSLSPLLTGRGTTYSFGTLALEFPRLRQAARSRKMNVNDAFMAAVCAGMARYHERHGQPVEQLRFNVPVSLRQGPGDRSGQGSNAVSIARFELPINGGNVDEWMGAAHEQVAIARAEPALGMADPLAEVSWVVPVPVLAQAAQASDVTASNVPGPPIPMYLCGQRVLAIYPLVATIGAAVNVTMVTYDGSAFIGVSADDRAVGDLGALIEDLVAGFEDVSSSTGAP